MPTVPGESGLKMTPGVERARNSGKALKESNQNKDNMVNPIFPINPMLLIWSRVTPRGLDFI